MDHSRRPSLASRTLSTPLTIATMPIKATDAQSPARPRLDLNLMTPPASPRHFRSSSDLSVGVDSTSSPNCTIRNRNDSGVAMSPPTPLSSSRQNDERGALICPFEIDILKDQRGRTQTFGSGAWSTVFKGTCHQKSASGMMTPPLSPTGRPPLLVAVKQAARKDATAILESEAKILSHLMFAEDYDLHVVQFFGVLESTTSLVLAAVPLSLEQHIKQCAIIAKASRTTWNMSDPVVGKSSVWLDLAHKLVSGLAWLHERAMIIHGDIKPGNILLLKSRSIEGADENGDKLFPYDTLFADFSSSQRIGQPIAPNTLSAVTREYTAPELLSSKVLSNPCSTATQASDVFSLAITLLVAASGNTMVYSGSVFQRQAMATQGWMAIAAVRNGPLEEGARVPRQGVVERALEKAVLREGMGRTDAVRWQSRIEEMMMGEPCKS